MKKPLTALILLVGLTTTSAHAWENLYANDGTYLGNTSSNQFDPNSINNPYGRFGNPYSAHSIKNQFGQYGSEFSPTSPSNPFAAPGQAVPQFGGTPRPYGGYRY